MASVATEPSPIEEVNNTFIDPKVGRCVELQQRNCIVPNDRETQKTEKVKNEIFVVMNDKEKCLHLITISSFLCTGNK